MLFEQNAESFFDRLFYLLFFYPDRQLQALSASASAIRNFLIPPVADQHMAYKLHTILRGCI